MIDYLSVSVFSGTGPHPCHERAVSLLRELITSTNVYWTNPTN